MANPVPAFNTLPQVVRAQFVASLDMGLKDGSLDLKDKDAFIRVLTTAIKYCGLDQNDLADLFETSSTSISRWINGKTLPHQQYRKPIIQKLKDKISEMSQNDDIRRAV